MGVLLGEVPLVSRDPVHGTGHRPAGHRSGCRRRAYRPHRGMVAGGTGSLAAPVGARQESAEGSARSRTGQQSPGILGAPRVRQPRWSTPGATGSSKEAQEKGAADSSAPKAVRRSALCWLCCGQRWTSVLWIGPRRSRRGPSPMYACGACARPPHLPGDRRTRRSIGAPGRRAAGPRLLRGIGELQERARYGLPTHPGPLGGAAPGGEVTSSSGWSAALPTGRRWWSLSCRTPSCAKARPRGRTSAMFREVTVMVAPVGTPRSRARPNPFRALW